jgi:hypothetical protein
MKRSRRWWQRERNDVARAERREAVREAGSHTRWRLEPSACRCIADYAIAFGVRCPRTFRAYATKYEPLDGYDGESPF